jgi:hypothetical protein
LPPRFSHERVELAGRDFEVLAKKAAEYPRELDLRPSYGLTTRLRAAEAQHALGHVDEALDESRVAVEIARRFGAASSRGAAPRIRGRLAGDEEALEEAVGRCATHQRVSSLRGR